MLTAKAKYQLIALDLISNRTNTTFGCSFTTISSVITTISNYNILILETSQNNFAVSNNLKNR
jgi:hypothetical protein